MTILDTYIMEPSNITSEPSMPDPEHWRMIRLDKNVPNALIKKIKTHLTGTPELLACYLFQISEAGKDPEPALGFLYPKPIPAEEFEIMTRDLLDQCLEDMQNADLFFETVMIGPERKEEATLNGRLVYLGKKKGGFFADIGTFLILGGILIGIIVGGILLWKQHSKPEPAPPPPPPPVEVAEKPTGPLDVVESKPNTFTNVDPAEDKALEASKDCKNTTTIIEGTTIREICND